MQILRPHLRYDGGFRFVPRFVSVRERQKGCLISALEHPRWNTMKADRGRIMQHTDVPVSLPVPMETEGTSAAKQKSVQLVQDLFDPDETSTLEMDVERLDEIQLLRLEVDQALESAINEMNALREEYSNEEGESLIELCKQNVIDTIVGQFGIASLFIEAKDGGSVTTARNFEKGITSTEADAARHDDLQSVRNGGFKERRTLYDDRKNDFRADVKSSGVKTVLDGYTGDKISIKRADVDHVVSAKEIETDSRAHLFLDQEQRARVATDSENLVFTKDKINRSKGAKDLQGWMNREVDGQTNADRFGIDREKAVATDKKARKHISGAIDQAAAKKYSKELLATGGEDAAKMAAFSAIGVVIHDFSLAVVEELKFIFKNRGNMSFKELFAHFKAKMADTLELLKLKWRDILAGSFESGIVAFLSNVLVFVINLFATTLKKLVSMIRAGFVSLCKAIKLMAYPPETMTREEANFEAAKILMAGVIGALSIGMSAAIEKFLQSIPGLQPIMMFPIPSFGGEQRTVSDVLAVTLSAVAGGLATTIVIYFMDKFASAGKHDKLQMQMITTSGVIIRCEVVRSWFAMHDAYVFLAEEAHFADETNRMVWQCISNSSATVADGLRGWDAIKSRMGK